MILFQTTIWQLDLSNLPITLNESNDWFTDTQTKSYSYPFNLQITDAIADKLELVTINNITNYKNKIYGTLIIDNEYYNAYLTINEVVGTRLEVTLFYGTETLEVFDKKLSALPFPNIFAVGGLRAYAKNLITQSWPEATHNFPMVFREAIKNESNFENFNLFLNHYYNNNGTYEFKDNFVSDLGGGEEMVSNRNVMCPFPYLLEVLKLAFKSEGKTIAGDFVNDDFNKKILLVPQNYMEQYSETQLLNYSFSNFTSQEVLTDKILNVYTQIHTPLQEGAYSLDIRINMSNVVAQYFSLTVTQAGVELYSAFSENREVIIEKTLDITIVDTNVFENIEVQLKLQYQDINISEYNSFKYQYNEGQLNIFPEIYNLANFMPDLTFREFTNRIKTAFNLKFDYTDTIVYINYLDNEFDRLTFTNHSHLQQPDVKRTLSKNNLFKLQHPNGDEIMVNNSGQIYSDADYTDAETEKIEIKVLPLKVKEKYSFVTAIYPEDDEEDIMLCLYNGLVGNIPFAANTVNNKSLELQDIYKRLYKNWLRFRANSETYNDSFYISIHDELNIKKGSFKYNKNHIVKSIERKRISEQWWKCDVESETL